MKYYLSALALFFQFSLLAQEKYEYGRLNPEDIEMQQYDKDSTAEAMVLFDLGDTRFVRDYNSGLDIKFTHTIRIKILEESGVDWGDVEIRYYVDGYGRTERVENLKACSYNFENGRLIKSDLKKEDVFEEKITGKWRSKNFAIPNVKKGSIIEYTYELISPFMWNLPSWEFQSSIPTVFSEYTVRMVPFYEYIVLYQGIKGDELTKKSYEDVGNEHTFGGMEYKDMIYKNTMSDIPAFVDDEFITSPSDYIKGLEFQLAKVNNLSGGTTEHITTWKKLTEDFTKEETFGRYIKSAERMVGKEIIPSLLAGKNLSEMEVIETVTKYVRNSFRWNEFYGKYATQTPKELMKSRTGAAADINLMLVAMLRAAGLKANPVLISTRGHGKIYPNYPITGKFNYVIAQANLSDGKGFLLLDATEPMLPYYLLPTRCYNDQGYIIDLDEQAWMQMTPAIPSVKVENSIIKLINEELQFTIREQLSGYDALSARKKHDASRADFEASLVFESEEMTSELDVSNVDNYDEPMMIKYKKTRPADHFEGDIYFIPFNKVEYTKNPLRLLKREYPIDLVYTKKRVYDSTIAIEKDKSFKHIPDNLNHEDELMKFEYNATPYSDFLKINASFELKKNIYQPEEYDQLKKDFELIYNKLNEQVVVGTKS